MSGLLDGVRLVDLSRVLAGPYAAQVLAEMGADVVKVEPPSGDPARAVGPIAGERSLYFSAVNTGKRSAVLDLREPADRDVLDRLLGAADVVVENYRPDAAAELGLLPGDLLARHPRLVVVTVSGYARGSADARRPAFDVTVQAEAGVLAVTGEQGGPPVRAGVPIGDLAAGLWAALAAVGGLVARGRDGRGRHVEVPLFDATLPLLSYMATTALAAGEEPDKVGSGHHSLFPYGAYPTADGWVVVAVLSEKFWPLLCEALGLDDLAGRADLVSAAGRRAARDEVDAAVGGAIGKLSTTDALAGLAAAGVPHAPVAGVLEALRSAYARERGMVQVAGDGSYEVVQGPLRDGSTPRPAPALGEHTAAVRRATEEGAGWPPLA